MAWRTGARLFWEMWPLILARVEPDYFREDFVRDLLDLFLNYDMDPYDLAGLHPEVDRALEGLTEDEGTEPEGVRVAWRPVAGELGRWRPVEEPDPERIEATATPVPSGARWLLALSALVGSGCGLAGGAALAWAKVGPPVSPPLWWAIAGIWGALVGVAIGGFEIVFRRPTDTASRQR